jgi:hypothetical protein
MPNVGHQRASGATSRSGYRRSASSPSRLRLLHLGFVLIDHPAELKPRQSFRYACGGPSGYRARPYCRSDRKHAIRNRTIGCVEVPVYAGQVDLEAFTVWHSIPLFHQLISQVSAAGRRPDITTD